MFWRGEIDRIHGWNDILGQLWNYIVGPLRGVLRWMWTRLIKPGVSGLTSAISAVLGGVSEVVGSIFRNTGSILGKVVSVLTNVNVLPAFITTGLNLVTGNVGALFNSAIGTLFSGFGRVDAPGIVASYNNVVATFEPEYKSVYAHTSPITPEDAMVRSIKWEAAANAAYIGLNTAMIMVEALSIGQIDAAPVQIFNAPLFRNYISTASRMAATRDEASILIPLRQYYLKAFTPEIPSIGEVTRMMWRGKATIDDLIRTILLRGYGAPWLGGYLALAENLPGSGDLIRFVVREVIEPAEFTATMGMQGFSLYWAAAYWEAHWLLPPPERTRTAFLRKQIPEAEYRKFLIWYDFKPDPRPGISLSDVDIMLNTQYVYPGRIDSRWLAEWGIITPDQLVELIKAGGMDPTWAPKAAEAYLLNQVREELGKVRAVYEKRLRAGFMSKVGFAQALHGIHYAAHVINALVLWADEALDLDERLEVAAEYRALAKKALITPDQFGNNLRELGMVEERITREVKHVQLLLAIKEAGKAPKATA